MPQTATRIQHVVILGGGTAGWLSAAVLSHTLRHRSIQVTLVESDQIGTIGVGEATIPTFVDTLRSLGIDEADFIRRTQASFKLGIRFDDWLSQGQSYLHPFGQVGQPVNHLDFFHYWQSAYQRQQAAPFEQYSPAAHMIAHNRFYVPQNAAGTPIQGAAYALHIDAGLAAQFFREYAEKRGVSRIEGKVTRVGHHINHDISHLEIERSKGTEKVAGDLYIDCSGFAARLIGTEMDSRFTDWSDFLPVNRAVTVQTTVGELAPVTVAKAQPYGWSWHIPLQHRTGNGYVFSRQDCDDETALNTLLRQVAGECVNEPRFINFTNGFRSQSWKGNCVAIGLASGFLEPLESTAIHLVSKSLRQLLKLFPETTDCAALASEYNRVLSEDYNEIRDFLVFHYCTTQRDDTLFWQRLRENPLPDTLQHKIALLKNNGWVDTPSQCLFQAVSWYAIASGMQTLPMRDFSLCDPAGTAQAQTLLQTLPKHIQRSVEPLPRHRDFIEKHCQSPPLETLSQSSL
ncbi:tryptophan halogenase family protein [Alteromonas oceanisediminis]|uniref:tryptophan halogenase family protein n=1 Tax=Alteromonas oceanisediminis TaxID=2836180 RepID=UPI001BD95C15|nr:tryptophan halogenase family protein [Alteromonas oceanisediminis]MBT0585902.1 tryptophan 7-halogenase [Alteromonas oceanisediminis]